MNNDQYVESVKQMMNQQNAFFGVFLTILTLVLGFIGILQWRVSDQQLKKIKNEMKQETIKEIEEKLNQKIIPEIYSTIDLKYKNIISDLEAKLEKTLKVSNRFEHNYLDNQLRKLYFEKDFMVDLFYLMRTHREYLQEDSQNLNLFIWRMGELIYFKIQREDQTITKKDTNEIIEHLEFIASVFPEEPEHLVYFKNAIESLKDKY